MRRFSLVLAVVVPLALAGEPALPSAPERLSAASGPDAPRLLHGVIRYELRGIGAIQGGILSSFIAGGGGAAALFSRLSSGLGPLAAKLGERASPGDVAKAFKGGLPFDLNSLPFNAEYGANVAFTLQETKPGLFELRAGTVHWSARSNAELHLTGDNGNKHDFIDKFSGEGTASIDPTNSNITVSWSGKGSDRLAEVNIQIGHPMDVDGKGMWSAMSGLSVIEIEKRGKSLIWHLQALGNRYDEAPRPDESFGRMSYGRKLPMDSLFRYREVYQDLMDNGVRIEWELTDECSAELKTPPENDELVFDRSTPGRIKRQALAEATPSFLGGYLNDLHWEFPNLEGSELTPAADSLRGSDFPVTYTNLPEKNTAFAMTDVRGHFEGAARQAGCRDPKPHAVTTLFSREATNHPGGSAKASANAKEGTPDPNWFFYWKQTKAANGQASLIRYGGQAKGCTEPKTVRKDGKAVTIHEPVAVGYYDPGANFIVLCDFGMVGFMNGFPAQEGVVGREYFEGIDLFGSVVRHELKHKSNYEAWWPKGYDRSLDTDGDMIPDKVEPTLAVPKSVATRIKHFDPNKFNSFGYKMEDEHYLAWDAGMSWNEGSADPEDWSCPGHQAFGNCE